MVLKIENISKSFEEKQVIHNISLQLNNCEIVCLLGVSGVGKSTLFNIISGVSSPDSGKVFLGDEDITSKPGHISYMLQKDMLLPYKTVLDNVALPLIINKKNAIEAIPSLKSGSPFIRRHKEILEYASSFFDEFGLKGYENKYPSQMSGGMRQRAALLRTYLFSNKVALLDEPFSALDALTKADMHEWYISMMEKIKLSTLFITHDIDEAIYLSDRIYVLAGQPGQIIDEIAITRSKPRNESFKLSSEFLDYKRTLTKLLNGSNSDSDENVAG